MNHVRLKLIAVTLALAVLCALSAPAAQAAPIRQEAGATQSTDEEAPPLATASATVELSNQS